MKEKRYQQIKPPLIELLDAAKLLTEWNLSLTSDRLILPKRRGATIAPDNGVPLTINRKRDRVPQDLAVAERT